MSIHNFFELNHPIVMFIYGLTFFTLGLAIFLQTRRHSRLRLAQDLHWLAAFGILHGIYEWGDIFIPLQATYLPRLHLELIQTLHVVLLGLSFTCLLAFGVATLGDLWLYGRRFLMVVALLWSMIFWLTFPVAHSFDQWRSLATIWARYLLCLPGGLLAAYGLLYQNRQYIVPLKVANISRMVQVAAIALFIYSVFAGLLVRPSNFFPATIVNRSLVEIPLGIPIEVFRSLAGLVLVISMINVLEVFAIEIDRLIEKMEVDYIQAEERERIGQQIHDGAIQSIYSASLLLESAIQHLHETDQLATRLDRAKRVLNNTIADLRSYMVSLRTDATDEPLALGLQRLADDPRFQSLLHIRLKLSVEPQFSPLQVTHILAIVQECLANTIRHAHAHHVIISLDNSDQYVTLTIIDDGYGFDEPMVSTGFGLRTMRDRARLLGGKLNIQSAPQKGTSVQLSIPKEAC